MASYGVTFALHFNTTVDTYHSGVEFGTSATQNPWVNFPAFDANGNASAVVNVDDGQTYYIYLIIAGPTNASATLTVTKSNLGDIFSQTVTVGPNNDPPRIGVAHYLQPWTA
jgi:hypothetical protein